jgi:tyrosyl-tRNA synthetase
MKYLAKIAEAEKDWRMEANEIKAGRQKSMLTILEERGLVNTIAGLVGHDHLLNTLADP